MFIARAWEKVRSSLFYVPLLYGVIGVLLAQGALWADGQVTSLPDGLTATVDSSRAVLGVIASATLSFAGIAFSVSLLLISAAASQFSPRVVGGLFRDPFNKRVMGVVLGTFVYCLFVMRSVRGPLEEAGSAVVPSVSVLLAVVLGVGAIFAIVAFIDHAAHAMEVSTLLHGVTEDALERAHAPLPEHDADDDLDELDENADTDWFTVTFDEHGWVQLIDHAAILRAIGPGHSAELLITAGRYAIPASPLCRVPRPDPDDEDRVVAAIRDAVGVGQRRTLQQDVAYGVRQLADVALKALSPGINDPTTAQDALFHMATVVGAILRGPRRGRCHRGEDGRVLLSPQTVTSAEVVGIAFDEVRVASVGQPTVLIYLLEILRLLRASLPSDEHDAAAALDAQARLVLETSLLGDLLDADRQRVADAYANRFGAGATA